MDLTYTATDTDGDVVSKIIRLNFSRQTVIANLEFVNPVSAYQYLQGDQVTLFLPSATGGVAPYTYEATNAPTWANVDVPGRRLSGRAVAGVRTMTWKVTDSLGSEASVNISFNVLAITQDLQNFPSDPRSLRRFENIYKQDRHDTPSIDELLGNPLRIFPDSQYPVGFFDSLQYALDNDYQYEYSEDLYSLLETKLRDAINAPLVNAIYEIQKGLRGDDLHQAIAGGNSTWTVVHQAATASAPAGSWMYPAGSGSPWMFLRTYIQNPGESDQRRHLLYWTARIRPGEDDGSVYVEFYIGRNITGDGATSLLYGLNRIDQRPSRYDVKYTFVFPSRPRHPSYYWTIDCVLQYVPDLRTAPTVTMPVTLPPLTDCTDTVDTWDDIIERLDPTVLLDTTPPSVVPPLPDDPPDPVNPLPLPDDIGVEFVPAGSADFTSPVIHVGPLIDIEEFDINSGIRTLTMRDSNVEFFASGGAVKLFLDFTSSGRKRELNVIADISPVLATQLLDGTFGYRVGVEEWKYLNHQIDSVMMIAGTVEGIRTLEIRFLDAGGNERGNREYMRASGSLFASGSFRVRTQAGIGRLRKVEHYYAESLISGLPDLIWYHGLWQLEKGYALNGPPLYPVTEIPMSVDNGRDSALSLSPPHVPSFSATVHDDLGRFTLNRPSYVTHVTEAVNTDELDRWPLNLTNFPVRIVLEKHFGNEWLLEGRLHRPRYRQENNNRFIDLAGSGNGGLMTQNSFINVNKLYTPKDEWTVGKAIQRAAEHYAENYGIELEEILESRNFITAFRHQDFPVRLGYWWTSWETLWETFQKCVATQGPPASFYEGRNGRIVFYSGARNRPAAVHIGGHGQLRLTNAFSISDHVTDIVNDAVVPVQLKGFIAPGNIQITDDSNLAVTPGGEVVLDNDVPYISPEHLYEGIGVGGEDLRKGIFNNIEELYWHVLGGNTRTIPPGGSVVYRIDTGTPFRYHSILQADQTRTGGEWHPDLSGDVEILNASSLNLTISNNGAGERPVPGFVVWALPLNILATSEYRTSKAVRDEPATRRSLYIHRYRVFGYAGYQSIYPDTAEKMADWVVRYYRAGIKTIECSVFVPRDVRLQSEAVKLDPLRKVIISHPDYVEPFRMLVRTVRHRFVNHHHFIDLILDEDIEGRVGRSPLLS